MFAPQITKKKEERKNASDEKHKKLLHRRKKTWKQWKWSLMNYDCDFSLRGSKVYNVTYERQFVGIY